MLSQRHRTLVCHSLTISRILRPADLCTAAELGPNALSALMWVPIRGALPLSDAILKILLLNTPFLPPEPEVTWGYLLEDSRTLTTQDSDEHCLQRVYRVNRDYTS